MQLHIIYYRTSGIRCLKTLLSFSIAQHIQVCVLKLYSSLQVYVAFLICLIFNCVEMLWLFFLRKTYTHTKVSHWKIFWWQSNINYNCKISQNKSNQSRSLQWNNSCSSTTAKIFFSWNSYNESFVWLSFIM